MDQERRNFIKSISTFAALVPFSSIASSTLAAAGKRNPHIIIRTAWQAVNIGDIGHTLGLLEMLSKYLPAANVTIWPFRELDLGAGQLIKKKFPLVAITEGQILAGKPGTAALQAAFDTSDFLIHSSGSGFVAKTDVQAWWDLTKKPFGVYGVTLTNIDASQLELINNASFFYTRETTSLDHLLALKPQCPTVEFAPDATFAMEVADEQQASLYLQEAGLKAGEFICVIPRLRYTPYFLMRNLTPTADEKSKYAISQFYKEVDHEKLRDVIIRWVRETGLKVLVCPEVTYQVELGKEVLVDLLPNDVKDKVIWRNTYWLPDLAQGVYAKSRALVCFEPHSPIMAIHKGVPSMYVRQPTDTRKGQMFRDIGLGDWLFEIDFTAGIQIFNALKEIHEHYPKALKKVEKAQQIVLKRQQATMAHIQKLADKITD